MIRIHDEIDRLFQEFPTPNFRPFRDIHARVPVLDLYEKGENIVVEAELPGIDKSDVEVSYTDALLTIQGTTKQEKVETKEGYYRSERQYGSFYRTLTVPQSIDFEKAKVAFKNGVLTITLPKSDTFEDSGRTIPTSD